MEYMDYIFLWLGKTDKPETEFNNYFKLDYSNENKICGFCIDIDQKWYDEDFIGYLKFANIKNILEILDEVPINPSEKDKVLQKCNEIDLKKANAVYWYSGLIAPNYDKDYNGLKYIGRYLLD